MLAFLALALVAFDHSAWDYAALKKNRHDLDRYYELDRKAEEIRHMRQYIQSGLS
jgi:hypothetical protein